MDYPDQKIRSFYRRNCVVHLIHELCQRKKENFVAFLRCKLQHRLDSRFNNYKLLLSWTEKRFSYRTSSRIFVTFLYSFSNAFCRILDPLHFVQYSFDSIVTRTKRNSINSFLIDVFNELFIIHFN